MKKLFLVVGIVLGLVIGFVVITQIVYRGDYYRQVERWLIYKNCPAYIYLKGEYIGTIPELSVIKSEVDSLGFAETDVSKSEDKKIVVVIAGKSNDQTVIDKVRSALLKLGNFQEEEMTGVSAEKMKTCPTLSDIKAGY